MHEYKTLNATDTIIDCVRFRNSSEALYLLVTYDPLIPTLSSPTIGHPCFSRVSTLKPSCKHLLPSLFYHAPPIAILDSILHVASSVRTSYQWRNLGVIIFTGNRLRDSTLLHGQGLAITQGNLQSHCTDDISVFNVWSRFYVCWCRNKITSVYPCLELVV